MSYEGQFAVLESRTNGYSDIATLVYNSTLRNPLWKLHKFNGNTYQNTYQDVQPTSNQIVLTFHRDQGRQFSSSSNSSTQYSRCSTNPNNYCLRRGDRGELVRELISNLTCLGYYSGVNDGIFGSGTETGIRNFQRNYSLTIDGVAGPQTRNLLSQQCRRQT